MADKSTPIRATCHCGAITVTVPRVPDHILHCQCTICRRYGAAWSYYNPDEVKIETKPNAITKKYMWGDREKTFDFCDTCGCVMYWWPLERSTDPEEDKMGVNTCNMNPELLRFVDRKFEYSWVKQPIGSKETAHPDDLAQY